MKRKKQRVYEQARTDAQLRLRVLSRQHPRTSPDRYVHQVAREVAMEYDRALLKEMLKRRDGIYNLVIDLERLDEFGLLDTDYGVSYFREGDLVPGLGSSPSTSVPWLVCADLFCDLVEVLREEADAIDNEREVA